MTKRQPQQQDLIPDDNAPPQELLDHLHELLDAESEHTAQGKRNRDKRDALLVKMAQAKIEKLTYVDARTGKRKYFVADTTAKAKKITAAGSPGKRKRAREKDVEIGGEVKADDVVESRRVSRKSVEAEIDPFASTRSKMEH